MDVWNSFNECQVRLLSPFKAGIEKVDSLSLIGALFLLGSNKVVVLPETAYVILLSAYCKMND